MMRTTTSVLAALWIALWIASGQATARPQGPEQSGDGRPSFDVASVKPSPQSASRRQSRIEASRYIASNATARDIIKTAYGLAVDDQLRGPQWLDSERFDITANAGPGSTRGQIQVMLQRLLAERFNLSIAHERARLPVYALVRTSAQEAPGLKAKDAPCCGSVSFAGDSMLALGLSMPRLAELLSQSSTLTGVDRLVLDRTGLDGVYEVTVRYSPPPAYGLRRVESPDLPGFFTALREQAGLALEPRQEDVEIVLVRSIERPSPN
jgi:uncharacterized protein (TIGR03435 family)